MLVASLTLVLWSTRIKLLSLWSSVQGWIFILSSPYVICWGSLRLMIVFKDSLPKRRRWSSHWSRWGLHFYVLYHPSWLGKRRVNRISLDAKMGICCILLPLPTTVIIKLFWKNWKNIWVEIKNDWIFYYKLQSIGKELYHINRDYWIF